jgi:hypothetical protein
MGFDVSAKESGNLYSAKEFGENNPAKGLSE